MTTDVGAALRARGQPVNVMARELGVPRSSLLSVLAGNARAGTVALVAEKARGLGWLVDSGGGGGGFELKETDPAPAA